MRLDPAPTLYAGALFLALAGLVLRLAPAAVPRATAPQVAIAQPEVEATPAGTLPADSFGPIVAGNIFDQGRSPPEARYVPEELAARSEPPAREAAPAPRGPRLFGVAVGPADAVALIDANAAIPGAEVYRVGDMVAGARLIEIGDTTVVLEGPEGRRVLRLPSSSRRSP